MAVEHQHLSSSSCQMISRIMGIITRLSPLAKHSRTLLRRRRASVNIQQSRSSVRVWRVVMETGTERRADIWKCFPAREV